MKQQKQAGSVDPEIAEITQSLTTKVKSIIDRQVSAVTKTTENQVKQLREQLASMKSKRHLETKTLKEERNQAQCELGQLKISFDNLKTERDALVRKVRNGS